MGKHSYGVILDAGSSGTRVYVYNWEKAAYARANSKAQALERLPEIKTKKKWRKKVHPGVSTFGERPEDVGSEHLAPLVDFALGIVPEDEVASTPIFLLATAGMRLLPEYQRAAVLDNVCGYFQKNTRFQLPDCGLHVQVIPGETEGLYGWIAANYLLGGFDAPEEHDHGKGHSTYGFLDMGGASAQIAFAPNATETEKHAEDLKLLRLRKINGESLEYKVFVTTWLGFGANEARRRYVESLLEAYPKTAELPDPCLPVGLKVSRTGEELEIGSPGLDGKEPHLIGTGKFTECLKRTFPLLEKDKPCEDHPCLLNGVHTPAIDFGVNHFVGVSEFWHTTHEVFAMAHKDKAYDFQSYQRQVTELCSRDWSDIEADVAEQKWGKKVDEKTVEEVCFKASWLINVLHDGIGVPRVGIEASKGPSTGVNNTHAVVASAKDRGFLDPFQAVDSVHGTEVSWTLGKIVLYASSQMPGVDSDSTLAVGFGSNKPGTPLPADFQYPSAKVPLPGNTTSPLSTSEAEDWDTRIFHNSTYTRRAPGILIFLLILAFAVYLLCGRERRASLQNFLSSRFGRSSPPGSGSKAKKGKLPAFLNSKLFGSSAAPAYERLYTDGIEDDDLEMGALEDRLSDTSDPPRTGRTSGWATPATRGLSPDFARASPKSKSYFDAAFANGLGISQTGGAGGGGKVFERGGLVGRTESKERLALTPGVTGHRSRAGSPRRAGVAMTPLKESID